MSDAESQSVPADSKASSKPIPVTLERSRPSRIRSFLRLAVGSVIEGSSQFINRLEVWDQTAQEQAKKPPLDTGSLTPAQIEVLSRVPADEDETDSERLRYAVVGLLFKTEEKIRRKFLLMNPLQNRTSRALFRVIQPAINNRYAKGAQHRFDLLVSRGEKRAAKWVKTGRIEEKRSRIIAQQALGTSIDEVIEHLAVNPEVRELVQQQGLSLAGQVVDEVRTRTVTADNLLERLARNILRKTPRKDLPEPPLNVQQAGKPFLEFEKEENLRRE